MNQKTSQPYWTDEKGHKVEVKRLTKVEKLQERSAASICKKALKINSDLLSFKTSVIELCDKVYEQYMEENNNSGKVRKGGFTWYNFDKTIKIEVSINEPIKFDDLAITACKDKLDEFLDNNIDSKNEIIKEMITDAFETSRGKLDTKKVMSLLSYKHRVSDAVFLEAMDLLEKGITRPESKKYFRIWQKDNQGEYQNIDLNFSSVK
jgi:hypothetical protein